jgi:Ni/Co efflux regulator RcnB
MWAIGGFLLGPLALLATLGLSDRKAQRAQHDLLEETRRQNEWMRRKMYEAEEERRYYEEQRYRQRTRQFPPEDYYEEEEYDEHYDYDGYDRPVPALCG